MIKTNIKKILNTLGFDLIKYDNEIQNLNFNQIIKNKLIKKKSYYF